MSKAVIAVVDDDEGVRDSLAALFEARGHVVATFATAQAFLTRIADLDLGCVLLDVRLPDMGGLDVQQRLRDKGLNVPVVIMTGYGDVALAVSAMKAGARDFIEKPFQSEQIGKAVEEALGSQSSAGRAADTRMAGPGIDVLTPRELEVLELLVEGLQNKMVARRLDISPSTAEVHRANIMRKLEAENFSHLIRIALAAGI